METPIHKIELYVIELNDVCGIDEIKTMIEQYGLENQLVNFGKVETKDLGEWNDDNPWNKTSADPNKLWEKIKSN